jgi:hypothetical protein
MSKYDGLYEKGKRHPPTTEHNHKKLILQMYADGTIEAPAGEWTDITVQHDLWCDLYRGKGFCNCEPDIIPGKPASKIGSA